MIKFCRFSSAVLCLSVHLMIDPLPATGRVPPSCDGVVSIAGDVVDDAEPS